MDTNELISSVRLTPHFSVDILRLDKIHPVVSGNKYFKLKYFIKHALENKIENIVTQGGPYSNHLHATAYACRHNNIKCIGLVNGNVVTNPTIQDCQNWGMNLKFIGYGSQAKDTINIFSKSNNYLFVPAGGNSALGVLGAQEILSKVPISYSDIFCAVGTGTTLAGIINTASPNATIHGICAVNDTSIEQNIKAHVNNKSNWRLHFNYAFGGFAKINEEIKNFILEFYKAHNILLDAIYTAKMMMAILEMHSNKSLTKSTKILCIHTGGLQGNAGFNLPIN